MDAGGEKRKNMKRVENEKSYRFTGRLHLFFYYIFLLPLNSLHLGKKKVVIYFYIFLKKSSIKRISHVLVFCGPLNRTFHIVQRRRDSRESLLF
jgi:hypothetical protein